MKFSEQYGEKERNEQGKKKVFVVCLDLIYTLFIPYLYLIYTLFVPYFKAWNSSIPYY